MQVGKEKHQALWVLFSLAQKLQKEVTAEINFPVAYINTSHDATLIWGNICRKTQKLCK